MFNARCPKTSWQGPGTAVEGPTEQESTTALASALASAVHAAAGPDAKAVKSGALEPAGAGTAAAAAEGDAPSVIQKLARSVVDKVLEVSGGPGQMHLVSQGSEPARRKPYQNPVDCSYLVW